LIVYKTTNLVNGKIYVGQDRKNNSNYLGSGIVFERALKKHGKENFKKEILEECNTQKELNKRERFWIKKTNCQDPKIGYNVANGGNLGKFDNLVKVGEKISQSLKGHKVSEETKRKLKEVNLGKRYSLETNKKKGRSGSSNPFFGRHHSEDSKKLIKEKIDERGGMKRNKNPFFGRKHSPESIKAIRDKTTGVKYSSEVNKKKGRPGESNPFFGRKHSKKTLEVCRISAKLQHAKKVGDSILVSSLTKNLERLNEGRTR